MSEEELIKSLINGMPKDILINTYWTLYKDSKAKDLEIERLNNDFTTLKLLQQKHLEEIERLKNELELQNIEMGREIERLKHNRVTRNIKELVKENEQLNLIINKYEKWLNYKIKEMLDHRYLYTADTYEDALDHFKELKGDDKEC